MEECRVQREAQTVLWVRRRETGAGDAYERSLPVGVTRRADSICGVRFAWRKEVRRLVRRRGGRSDSGFARGECRRRPS